MCFEYTNIYACGFEGPRILECEQRCRKINYIGINNKPEPCESCKIYYGDKWVKNVSKHINDPEMITISFRPEIPTTACTVVGPSQDEQEEEAKKGVDVGYEEQQSEKQADVEKEEPVMVARSIPDRDDEVVDDFVLIENSDDFMA